MFYIFHGDEEFTRSEAVSQLKAQIMTQGLGDLNVSILSGRRVALEELISTCNTVPFLADRRLIIVEGLLERFDPRRRRRDDAGEDEGEAAPAADTEYADRLAAYLPHLPPFARLLFVEERALNHRNPILQLASKEESGHVRLFATPNASALPAWIQQRAKERGTAITRQASQLLVTAVGANLRALDVELEKLAGLANYARAITPDDIQALVSSSREADIFALVDTLGLRNRAQAMRRLHALLADQANELYLLSMIARQIRLIISVKDLSEEMGMPAAQVRKELGISHAFIVDKLLRQSTLFRMAELEAIQGRVLALDQAIKTGQIEGPLGLELLVLEICQRTEEATGGGHQVRKRSRTR